MPSIAPRFRRLVLGLLGACLMPAFSARAAEAPAATPPADKNQFHLYLLMGQSNMAGRDTRQLASQQDNPRVLALTGEGRWTVARDPIHAKIDRIEPGAGPGIPFARAMVERAGPGVSIGLIPCAVGGSPLRRWVKGGDLYQQALAKAREASKAGVLTGILWHQGETDSEKQETAATYQDRLAQAIRDFRQDLGRPELPVVVGQLGPFLTPEKFPGADAVRAALKGIPQQVPHAAFADSDGLTDKGDKLHFDAGSSAVLGRRFAAAMSGLSTP